MNALIDGLGIEGLAWPWMLFAIPLPWLAWWLLR